MVFCGAGEKLDSSREEEEFVDEEKQEAVSCTSQTTTSEGRNTDTLWKNIQLVYFEITVIVEKSILRCCRRKGSDMVPLVLALKKNWSWVVMK